VFLQETCGKAEKSRRVVMRLSRVPYGQGPNISAASVAK
jgi:hypothetical protein